MPVPPVIQSGHLSLPAFQIGQGTQNFGNTGDGSTVAYVTRVLLPRAAGWKDFALKAADANSLPVLFTQGFQDAHNNVGNAPSLVLRAPSVPFGKKSTLARLPRVLALGFGLNDYTPPGGPDLTAWLAAQSAWLDQGNISVVMIGLPHVSFEGDSGWLLQGLPLVGVRAVANAFGGSLAGVVDPTQFVAGQVYQISHIDYNETRNYALGARPPAVSNFDDGMAQADVGTNQVVYSRFAKRVVQGVASVQLIAPSHPSQAEVLAYNQALAVQLASYGFLGVIDLGTVLQADFQTALLNFYTAQIPAIKAFFGVS